MRNKVSEVRWDGSLFDGVRYEKDGDHYKLQHKGEGDAFSMHVECGTKGVNTHLNRYAGTTSAGGFGLAPNSVGSLTIGTTDQRPAFIPCPLSGTLDIGLIAEDVRVWGMRNEMGYEVGGTGLGLGTAVLFYVNHPTSL